MIFLYNLIRPRSRTESSQHTAIACLVAIAIEVASTAPTARSLSNAVPRVWNTAGAMI